MDHAALFEEYRSYLFAIAYRMLGAVMEAEDIVQETYLRWRQVDLDEVASPKSYLASITTRLCIDHLRSARVRREQYIGPWLPEPLVADPGERPAQSLALAESLTMAFLVLLESLTPEERAVYLLREVFGYGYDEIAAIVDKSEAACRKMVSRARNYLAARRPRYTVTPEESRQAVAQFMEAVYEGDMGGLMNVLDADVVWTSDGGGMRGVARRPIAGADNVARFALGLAASAPPGVLVRPARVNGGPGVLIDIDGRPYAALAFEVAAGRITAVRAVVNPEKLRHLR
jgi:RNA polymerase sigma-70 factor (ECF subfamily)